MESCSRSVSTSGSKHGPNLNSQPNMARTVALSWLLSSESSYRLQVYPFAIQIISPFVRPKSRMELLREPIQADTGYLSCATILSPPHKTKTTSQHYSHSRRLSKSMVFCYLSIILLRVQWNLTYPVVEVPGASVYRAVVIASRPFYYYVG